MIKISIPVVNSKSQANAGRGRIICTSEDPNEFIDRK